MEVQVGLYARKILPKIFGGVMSKGRRRGKALENYVAEAFCGFKQGLYGGEDVALRRFSVECKERENGLKTLEKWMQQAEENAKGKIAMVYFHRNNDRHERDLIIFRADARVQSMIQSIEEGK